MGRPPTRQGQPNRNGPSRSSIANGPKSEIRHRPGLPVLAVHRERRPRHQRHRHRFRSGVRVRPVRSPRDERRRRRTPSRLKRCSGRHCVPTRRRFWDPLRSRRATSTAGAACRPIVEPRRPRRQSVFRGRRTRRVPPRASTRGRGCTERWGAWLSIGAAVSRAYEKPTGSKRQACPCPARRLVSPTGALSALSREPGACRGRSNEAP